MERGKPDGTLALTRRNEEGGGLHSWGLHLGQRGGGVWAWWPPRCGQGRGVPLLQVGVREAVPLDRSWLSPMEVRGGGMAPPRMGSPDLRQGEVRQQGSEASPYRSQVECLAELL